MAVQTTQETPTRGEDLRSRLIQAAFWEIYRNGYQAASLSDILRAAGAAKGGLYHHFASKTELGYAVLDEVIGGWVVERWLDRLEGGDDPISRLATVMRSQAEQATPEMLELGCPLYNLTQEMSPLDEGFRARIESLLGRWQDGIAQALRRGIEAGTVRPDVDPDKVAAFVLAAFEGTVGVVKNTRDVNMARSNIELLIDYLETLRPAEPAVVSGEGR